MSVMVDFAITLPGLLGCNEIEGRVEVFLAVRREPASWHDPGNPGEIELGTVEVMTGRNPYAYMPMPSGPVGEGLHDAIQEALVGDEQFMERAMTEAHEDAASEREEAMERRWEERRDERLMEIIR